VGGSLAIGWKPDLQEEVQDAKEPEAGRHGGWAFQKAGLEVLPGEDKSLPFWTVPSVDEKSVHRPVLVVSVQDSDSDSGAPLQGVP